MKELLKPHSTVGGLGEAAPFSKPDRSLGLKIPLLFLPFLFSLSPKVSAHLAWQIPYKAILGCVTSLLEKKS